jgi:hypothetical protein
MLVSGIVPGRVLLERKSGVRRAPGSSAYRRDPGVPGTGIGRIGREDEACMSTRTLLILAAVTGVAILTAGAVQILLAR